MRGRRVDIGRGLTWFCGACSDGDMDDNDKAKEQTKERAKALGALMGESQARELRAAVLARLRDAVADRAIAVLKEPGAWEGFNEGFNPSSETAAFSNEVKKLLGALG